MIKRMVNYINKRFLHFKKQKIKCKYVINNRKILISSNRLALLKELTKIKEAKYTI